MSPGRARRGGASRAQAVMAIAAMGAVALAIALSLGGNRPATTAAPVAAGGGHAGHLDATVPPGYRLTGEVTAMGGRVIEPPAARSGTSAAGGVVVDGSDVALGHVPLAFAVMPTWQLRNTTDQVVTLGPPKVTVLKGCCPSDAVLGTATLAPGAETTLSYASQMHPGMDGEHLFRLSVPVAGTNEVLTLTVAAHFS